MVKLMKEKFGITPKLYKYMDGNAIEVRMLDNNPGLEELMIHIKHGEKY